jgi:uncharacterized protein (DUF2147 family)
MLTLLALFAIMQPEMLEHATMGIEGEWRNPKGTVVISIAPCGETSCGRVQWASEQAKADARKGGTDPLVGAELMKEITPTGDGRWRARLFVPDLNKTSKVELRLLGPDRLRVTGCLVGRVVCKSQVWARADDRGL